MLHLINQLINFINKKCSNQSNFKIFLNDIIQKIVYSNYLITLKKQNFTRRLEVATVKVNVLFCKVTEYTQKHALNIKCRFLN